MNMNAINASKRMTYSLSLSLQLANSSIFEGAGLPQAATHTASYEHVSWEAASYYIV